MNFLDVKHYKLLLAQFRELILPVAQAEDCKMPAEIAGYRFMKDLSLNDSESGYKFALYRNREGEKAFAKAWFGEWRDPRYYWLKKSTLIYKTENKTKIKVPELISIYEGNNFLVVLLKYYQLKKYRLERKDEVKEYNKIITFVQNLGRSRELKSELGCIGPTTIIVSSLLLFIKAVVSDRKNCWAFLRMELYILRKFLSLYKGEWDSLVHRDLRENMYLSGKVKIITDWQLVTYSHALLEVAHLVVGYADKPHLIPELLKLDVFKSGVNKDSFKEILKSLVYFLVFVQIDLVKTKNKESIRRMIRTVNSM